MSAKLASALEAVKVFETKNMFTSHFIDSSNRQCAFLKMRKSLETVGMLSQRYVGLDEYKNALTQDASAKPISKKKTYTFFNPSNMIAIKNHNDAHLPIVGGGLRPLLQEYELT